MLGVCGWTVKEGMMDEWQRRRQVEALLAKASHTDVLSGMVHGGQGRKRVSGDCFPLLASPCRQVQAELALSNHEAAGLLSYHEEQVRTMSVGLGGK